MHDSPVLHVGSDGGHVGHHHRRNLDSACHRTGRRHSDGASAPDRLVVMDNLVDRVDATDRGDRCHGGHRALAVRVPVLATLPSRTDEPVGPA